LPVHRKKPRFFCLFFGESVEVRAGRYSLHPPMTPELERLCHAYGIEPYYHDVGGIRHLTSDAVATEILEAMGLRVPGVLYDDPAAGAAPVDPVLVLEEGGSPLRIPFRSAGDPKPFEC